MKTAKLAPPWYVHPATAPQDWAWLAAQHRKTSFAVVNVFNGPGQDDDDYYQSAVAELRRIRVLGYVRLDFGNRPPIEVAHDVAAWQRRYHLNGIMFDELPSDAHSLARCAQYAAAARDAGITFLAANPGVFPSLAHLNLFDVTAVFEGTAEAYVDFEHPTWARNVPPSKLWHLIYACDPQRTADFHRTARNRSAGHVFATDRTLPNPWLGPPTAISTGLLNEHPSPISEKRHLDDQHG